MMRTTLRVVVGCAALLLLWEPAAAQPHRTDPRYLVQPQHEITSLLSSLRQDFVPVRVERLEGPSVLKAGEAGLFQGVVNVESATLPLRCEWDFGDGTRASGLAATHVFEKPGTYQVQFTASNGRSLERGHVTVTVRAPDGAAEPAGG